MEHKNQQTTSQNNPKKQGQCKQPLEQLQAFQHSHHGVPEEEKEQEIRNLFGKIMKENFPNLMKKIDMQVQEARESQTRWTQTGPL